jgi:hypothetical protein
MCGAQEVAAMTETIQRPATGAVINPNAYAEAEDFLPLKGIDYVEFWVGNARLAAAMECTTSPSPSTTFARPGRRPRSGAHAALLSRPR